MCSDLILIESSESPSFRTRITTCCYPRLQARVQLCRNVTTLIYCAKQRAFLEAFWTRMLNTGGSVNEIQ